MKTEYLVTWVEADGVYERPFPSLGGASDKEAVDSFIKKLKGEGRAVILSIRNVKD